MLEFVLNPPCFTNMKELFEGKKSYFMRAISSRLPSVASVRSKAVTDNFSVLSRVWRCANTYLFFKTVCVGVILSCDLYY